MPRRAPLRDRGRACGADWRLRRPRVSSAWKHLVFSSRGEIARTGGEAAPASPRPFSPRRRARDAPRVTSARADRERRDTPALDTHRKVRAGRSSRPPRAHDPPRVPSRSPRADVSRRAPFASPRRVLGKRRVPAASPSRVARRVSFGRAQQHPAHPSPSPPLAAPQSRPARPRETRTDGATSCRVRNAPCPLSSKS